MPDSNSFTRSQPWACALGYILTPLRGCGAGSPPSRRFEIQPDARGPTSDAGTSPFLSENAGGPVSCATRLRIFKRRLEASDPCAEASRPCVIGTRWPLPTR